MFENEPDHLPSLHYKGLEIVLLNCIYPEGFTSFLLGGLKSLKKTYLVVLHLAECRLNQSCCHEPFYFQFL